MIDREDQQDARLGDLKCDSVPVITTRLARGTPAMPLLVIISISSI
jgi:hypothetical protein